MAELDDLILEAVAAHLPARGLQGSIGANGLRVKAIGIAVRVRDAEQRPAGKSDWTGVSAIFQTGSIDSIGTGMEVLHTGMGESLAEAAANAAHQWIIGVLPVILSSITHREQPEVHHAKMVVALQDTGEQFGWDVHLGPIVTRMYSDGEPPDALPRNAIFRSLFDAIHPYAAHATLFWIECFAVHYPDGRVDATCRKQNDDWPEGQQVLLEWAAEWPFTEGIVSQRQFMVFEPVAVDEKLAQKLPLEHKKQRSWWKFWGRRA